MDPAFSLADELADVSNNDDSNGHAYYHNHHASLGDEFDEVYGRRVEDDTLQSLNDDHEIDDLASELQGVLGGGGGSLGDELALDSELGHTHTGSLADELDQHQDMSRTASQTSSSANAAYASASSSTPLGYDTGVESASPGRSGASSPTSRSKSSLSRASMFSSPSSRSPSTCLGAVPAADISESLQSTEHFLHQLASLSLASAGQDAEADTSSDTAGLESLASKFLKLVYQCTLDREAQIRELRDLERQASRLPSEARGFSLSSSSSYGSDLAASIPSTTAIAGLSDLEEEDGQYADDSYDPEDFDNGESSRDTLPTTPTAFRSKTLRKKYHSTASIASDVTIAPNAGGGNETLDPALFTDLHASTQSLLTSLTNLHEHAQVTKSSVTDAARKLKSARNILAQYHVEEDSVEKSLAWIQQNDAQSFVPDARADGQTSVRKWTDEQLDFCRRRLQDVDAQARTLLTPVSLIG